MIDAPTTPEEDEAFNEIERQAQQRKEAVKAAVHTLTEYQRGYETGFIDGMQKQAQSSVDKAVNAMSQPTYYIPSKNQRTWVGLTDEEVESYWGWEDFQCGCGKGTLLEMVRDIEAKLKERNT
jgi:hypothetical protein